MGLWKRLERLSAAAATAATAVTAAARVVKLSATGFSKSPARRSKKSSFHRPFCCPLWTGKDKYMSFQAAGGKGGEEDGSAWYLTTLVCTCQCYHSSSESWVISTLLSTMIYNDNGMQTMLTEKYAWFSPQEIINKVVFHWSIRGWRQGLKSFKGLYLDTFSRWKTTNQVLYHTIISPPIIRHIYWWKKQVLYDAKIRHWESDLLKRRKTTLYIFQKKKV